MKTLIKITLPLILTVSSSVSFAGQVNAHAAREGISSKIEASALKDLEAWIVNTKQDLDRDVQRAARVSINDKEKYMRRAIDRSLGSSDGRASEFMTRNVLYRAQEVHNELLKIESEPKRDAFARRFLEMSLEMARQLAPIDMQLLKDGDMAAIASSQERVQFGLNWATTMLSMSFALPTNESHVMILKKIMGFMFNDIVHDDKYNRQLAGIAKQFADQQVELDSEEPTTPLENLELAKKLREFLSDELTRASQSLGKSPSIYKKGATLLPSKSNCPGQICPGAIVLSTSPVSGRAAFIVGMVQTVDRSLATVNWSTFNGQAYRGDSQANVVISSISPEVSSYGNIQSGVIVSSYEGRNAVTGSVLRVFANGYAEVQWSSFNNEAYHGGVRYVSVSTLNVL